MPRRPYKAYRPPPVRRRLSIWAAGLMLALAGCALFFRFNFRAPQTPTVQAVAYPAIVVMAFALVFALSRIAVPKEKPRKRPRSHLNAGPKGIGMARWAGFVHYSARSDETDSDGDNGDDDGGIGGAFGGGDAGSGF